MYKLLEKMLRIVVSAWYRLLGKELQDKQLNVIIQFIKFSLVGLSNTGISYLAFLIGVKVGMQYLLANAFAFVISVLNSFYWNEKYVFSDKQVRTKRDKAFALIKTFIAYGSTGIVLNSVLLVVWVDILSISLYVAPLINLIITIPLNFVINKYWAFKVGEEVE